MITMHVRGTKVLEKTLREVGPREGLLLTRSTVGKVTSEIMKDAKRGMNFSGDYSTGAMKKGTTKRRRRARGGIVSEEIGVSKRAFYWRFYERGQGNNPRRAMFGKALSKMNSNLARRWEEHFLKAFTARLARIHRANRAKLRGR